MPCIILVDFFSFHVNYSTIVLKYFPFDIGAFVSICIAQPNHRSEECAVHQTEVRYAQGNKLGRYSVVNTFQYDIANLVVH